ncbi:hypothetical protein Ac2012v2_002696 [Leucoagaricus gongylophorus]
MYPTFLSAAFFFVFAINVVLADFAVSNPEITACKGQEVKVSWQPSKSPYNLIVVSADDPCGDALIDAGDFHQTFASFKVDKLEAGQKVQVSLEDADGEEGWSDIITVGRCTVSSSSVVASVSVLASVPASVPTSVSVSALVTASESASTSTSTFVTAPGSSVEALDKTTLIVTPTYTATDVASSSSVQSVDPVGAANAANPFGNSNAAIVPCHLSIPALIFIASGGVIALLM